MERTIPATAGQGRPTGAVLEKTVGEWVQDEVSDFQNRMDADMQRMNELLAKQASVGQQRSDAQGSLDKAKTDLANVNNELAAIDAVYDMLIRDYRR
jgi:flagellar motility protein MotE (MotC chaperone)